MLDMCFNELPDSAFLIDHLHAAKQQAWETMHTMQGIEVCQKSWRFDWQLSTPYPQRLMAPNRDSPACCTTGAARRSRWVCLLSPSWSEGFYARGDVSTRQVWISECRSLHCRVRPTRWC